MLSRRENLLIAPWQRRRYLDHRQKVLTALPAVDVTCPASREHVTMKKKKVQREYERCKKIEYDNFILIEHLNRIMSTSRVDNSWDTPPPDFLHRIAMFPVRRRQSPPRAPVDSESPKTRKERCVGCAPKHFQHELQTRVPEARVPYEPPKPRLSRRRSSVLAKEQMNKEIDRLLNLDLYRKRQNSELYHSQRSLSSSSRTNSCETQSPCHRSAKTRFPSANQNTEHRFLSANQSEHRFPSTNQKESRFLSANQKKELPSANLKGHKLPSTNQRAGRVRLASPRLKRSTNKQKTITRFPSANQTSQVSDLKLSSVQTFPDRGGSKGEQKARKQCARRAGLRQIELKKDDLELVLIFPARSKVTTSRSHS